MEYRMLGRSGLRVSALGLGTNSFGLKLDQADAKAVVDTAIDEGVTLFDVADHYGEGRAEQYLGAAIGSRRQDVTIATKFGWGMDGVSEPAKGSRRYILWAVENSLRRLGTDYIDLYQYHRPDGITPIEETLDALDDLVRRGLVRYVGCSNFRGWQLVDADATARARSDTPFISAQNPWSLMDRRIETELVPAAAHTSIGILPYSPLASGMLTGKYRPNDYPAGSRLDRYRRSREDPSVLLSTDRHWPMRAWQFEELLARDDNWALIAELRDYAEQRGHQLTELAFGWLNASQGVASVLAGGTTPDQIRANAAASAAWTLTPEEKSDIDAITAQRTSEDAVRTPNVPPPTPDAEPTDAQPKETQDD